MSELLDRAFKVLAELPEEQQDEVARLLLDEVLPRLREQGQGTEPREALEALVGLIDETLDVDEYLEETRGPAWNAELDGGHDHRD